VTVGRVNDIRVEDGIAVVTIAIDEGVDLPSDLSAEIRFRNLVGQRMVTLVEKSGEGSGLLQPGALITLEDTEPAFDLSVLFNGLRPLIRSTDPQDINIVSNALVEALGGRSDEVEGILANLADVGDVLASRDRELSSLLDNLNVVTGDLAGRDAQLRRTLANLHDFLADVSASREDLSQALVTLDDAATRFGRIIENNDENIRIELQDLETILDAVNDKRSDLRAAIEALPEMLVAVERVTSYGEWSMLHVVHVCKDGPGTPCGKRPPQ
jgi:phospholipid/cholesterol/gamma-HCH transport system substrate-binding protein